MWVPPSRLTHCRAIGMPFRAITVPHHATTAIGSLASRAIMLVRRRVMSKERWRLCGRFQRLSAGRPWRAKWEGRVVSVETIFHGSVSRGGSYLDACAAPEHNAACFRNWSGRSTVDRLSD
jgi:hypothetical protein